MTSPTLIIRRPDPAGKPFGCVVQRTGVLNQRPGRSKLYAAGVAVGHGHVGARSLTARAGHLLGRPDLCHHHRRRRHGTEVARIETDTTSGVEVTLEVHQTLPEPMRTLVVCAAVGPANPLPFGASDQILPVSR